MDKENISKYRLITIKNAKPTKRSGYYYFAIPNVYIKNGMISPDKLYDIYIEEIEKKSKK